MKVWQGQALLAFMFSAATTAIFYTANALAGLPFPAYDFMSFLIRELPGDVITFGIDVMSEGIIQVTGGDDLDSMAKQVEQFGAAVQFAVLLTLAGLLFLTLARRSHQPYAWVGGVFGVLIALPFAALAAEYNIAFEGDFTANALWQMALLGGWGALVGWSAQSYAALPTRTRLATPEPTAQARTLDRRQFLVQVGASTATVTILGATLAELLREEEVIRGGDVQIDQLTEGLQPAPGTRPEYTPLEDHYRIDINVGGLPDPAPDDYRLAITGLVDTPLNLSLEDIRAYEPMKQFVTLSCISNSIGGRLISTTQWTGVPMQRLLDEAGIQDNGTHILIKSFDGFFEVVDIELIRQDERIMLTYEWDDVPLPRKHGFPLRIYIPDRYGMKQPKWIESMDIIDAWQPGYWVQRGWSRDALVRTTSVIDTVAVDDIYTDDEGVMRVPIGGIAYSGAKGISKVEVQIDDGEWLQAQLRPPLSETTWYIWRLDWAFEPGEHTFTVRAYEGDETPQIAEENPKRPDGATGYHREQETIRA